MLSVEFYLGKDLVSVGIRQPLPGEDDATEKRKIQKGHQRKHTRDGRSGTSSKASSSRSSK
jgi:hypothetical protein